MQVIAATRNYLSMFSLVLLLLGCQGDEVTMVHHQGETMGTHYAVTWRVTTESPKESRMEAQIVQLLEEINQSMSTYIPDSELSLINFAPVGEQLQLSPRLARVVKRALRVSEQSNGAFDFTVGPLVDLWGFGPGPSRTSPPNEAQIQAVQERVGYEHLTLAGDTTLVKQREIKIDLSAIAKGFAVDAIAELLGKRGIKHYLVDIGGELRAGGEKAPSIPWRIGIERPDEEGRSIQLAIEARDIAVATSGDYRNYFEKDGVRYSHTIEPATGHPIRHGLASVTVLMPECMEADAIATALLVMGPEKARLFAEAGGIPAYFVVKSKDDFETYWSAAFESYLAASTADAE